MHMVVAILCHMSEEVVSNLEMFNALRALNTKKLVKDDPKVLDHIRRVQLKELCESQYSTSCEVVAIVCCMYLSGFLFQLLHFRF